MVDGWNVWFQEDRTVIVSSSFVLAIWCFLHVRTMKLFLVGRIMAAVEGRDIDC